MTPKKIDSGISLSPRDWDTLYQELGSRVFSEMAGENSDIGSVVVKKRALRAGSFKPRLKPGPSASLSLKPTASLALSGLTTKRQSGYKVGTLLHAQVGQEVLMVQLLRYSKKGNLICHVMGENRPDVTVARQDVLCAAEAHDLAPLTSSTQEGAH